MLIFMYSMPRGVVGSLAPWLARGMRRIQSRLAGSEANNEE